MAHVDLRHAATLALSAVLASLPLACKGHTQSQPAATPPAPAMKPAPPTPVEVKREEIGGPTWDPAWDAIIEQALPPEMLSEAAGRDLRRLCPQFDTISEADKRAFWAYFFQALAAAEAGLKPTANVRHADPAVAVKDVVTGQITHQEGLLQLTYQDSQRYNCDFNWEADRRLPPKDPGRTILQPKNNLECGIKILDNQIFSLHKPVLTRSSYWSTLRPGTPSFRVWSKQMANVPEACGVGKRHEVPPRLAGWPHDNKAPPGASRGQPAFVREQNASQVKWSATRRLMCIECPSGRRSRRMVAWRSGYTRRV